MPFSFVLAIAVPPLIGLGLWIYVGVFHSIARRKARFEQTVNQREDLDERTFYHRYFAERGVDERIPGEVRRIFAQTFGYPASRLRPDDVFYFLPEDSHQPCIEAVERAFGLEIDDEALSSMPCAIDPVVMYINGRLHSPTDTPVDAPQSGQTSHQG